MKDKEGFSLLELTLVLGVGSLMAFLKFQDMKNEQETVMANAVGAQIKQLGEAVNRYISVRYDKLSTLSDAAGTGTDPGPRTCNSDSCEISYKTLINEGFLPVSYTGQNLQKSSYKILLKRDGTSPNYVINGLIVTSTAWKDGTKIRYDLLGKAMAAAGIDSGMTKSATIASGYGGQWSEKSSDFNNITAEGLLAYRVGYDSSMYSVYLRRDGTLPMTGNLNMGGNDINNAKNITASGNASFGGTGEFENNLAVRGMSSSNQPPGYLGGVIAPDYYAQAGIYIAKNGKNISDTDWAFRANRDGYLEVSGNINAGKNISAGNWVIAHNGYGDVIRIGGDQKGNDFDLSLGGGKPLNIQGSENGTSYGTVQVRGEFNIADGGEMLNKLISLKKDGNIVASGNIKGKTVESTGRTTIGEYAQINGIVSAGDTCDSNGLQGRTQEGQLLSCVNGVWRASFINGNNENGYWTKDIESGLIKQWGKTNATGSKSFPVKFTNVNSITLNVSNCSDMGDRVDVAYGQITSENGFYTRTRQSTTDHGYTSYYICWSAVGY